MKRTHKLAAGAAVLAVTLGGAVATAPTADAACRVSRESPWAFTGSCDNRQARIVVQCSNGGAKKLIASRTGTGQRRATCVYEGWLNGSWKADWAYMQLA